MALLNFPSNPAPGETYTFGNQTYTWSGSAWLRSSVSISTAGTITATNSITVGTGNQTVAITSSSITVGSGNQTVTITSSSININNGSVLTTATVYSVLSTGTGISINTSTGQVVISSIATLQDVTNNGYTTTDLISILNNSPSISTASGALQVAGGVGIGGGLFVGGTVTATLFVGNLAGTASTATSAATAYSTIGTHTAGTGLTGSTFNGSADQTWSLNTATLMQTAVDHLGGSVNATTGVFSGITTVTNTTSSISTTTGALQVAGGVGIGGDLHIGGDIYTTNLNIADAVFDSTLILVNTIATTVVDSYPISQFRSAKYLIQIDEGMGPAANFQVIEILLLVDNVGTVYATEYGVLTSNGELGEFAAEVGTDNQVKLYFTAYQESNKELVVLRTALAV
jgi:hypothetical protein